MGNPVKFNSTTETDCFNQSNFYMGVGERGFGPTSQTGFYAGATPPEGGYVTYQAKASGGPSIRTATSDSELISLVNQLTNNSFTTLRECFNYTSGVDDFAIVKSNQPPVITDGLVINLDPSNILSYPHSGSTLYDLSGYENNAEIINSPQFITSSGGYMNFDGTSDYLEISMNSTLDNWSQGQTLIMWLYQNIESGRRNPWDQAYGGFGTWTFEGNGSGNMNNYFGDAGRNAQPYVGRTSNSLPDNKWIMMTSTRDTSTHKWYENYTNTRTYDHNFGELTETTANIRIGRGYAGYWQGRMGRIMSYDRALSQDEIQKIYFGGDIPTSGLKMAFNRSHEGIVINDNGLEHDLANVYTSKPSPWGYEHTDLDSNFDSLTQFTYCLWLHCYSHHTGYSQSPFNKYSGTTTAVIRLYDFGNYNGNNDNGKLGFYLNAGGSWTRAGGLTYMDVGETAFIVCQYNSTNGGQLWKNGEKVSNRSASGTIASNETRFYITTPEYGNKQYTKVKEAYVYNTELTDDEILSIYNSTKGRYF